MISSLIDNDILYKSVIFDIYNKLNLINILSKEHFGVLATSKFVLSKKIKRKPGDGGVESTLAELQIALNGLEEIEPNEQEILLAAELEYIAQVNNLPFDAGESQLCSILIFRNLNYLLTGDKRAIKSLEILLLQSENFQNIKNSIMCLEQLIVWLTEKIDTSNLREKICLNREHDISLSLCFSCHSPEIQDILYKEALESYINNLRNSASNVLYR